MQDILSYQSNAAVNYVEDSIYAEKYNGIPYDDSQLTNNDYIDNVRSIYGNLRSPLEARLNMLYKRCFDIILSSFLLLGLLSWLVPLFIILIKLDSKGPAFFLQKRKKKNGKLFTCIKLRTMVVNEEADRIAALENDSRITRIGKILRQYHVDELPQLWNVLIGDMSIIGPRPYMLIENLNYEKQIKEYSDRYKVKPGITGLAQSLGYFGFTDDLQKIDERVMLDLIYIKRWSFKMDIQILARTFLSIFS